MVAWVPNQVFQAFSGVAWVMTFIPLYWHLEAWNIGTCMFIFWAGGGSLIFFINSIIWNGNVKDVAPVWCDISTRFILGIGIGIPATSLAINRRLYKISSVRQVIVPKSEKRREMAIDFALTLIFPFTMMALQYVVQDRRYNIFEDVGCLPSSVNTPLTYIIIDMWPIITGLCASTYCTLTIRNFWRRGRAFREVLSSHSKNLSQGRYVRLMLLAAVELFATLPLSSYIIYSNATTSEVVPYGSWEDVHADFSQVGQFPRVFWEDDASAVVNLNLERWLTIGCAFVFIGFFGFASEARKHYRAAYTSLASRLGVTTISSSSFSDSRYGTSKAGVAVHISTYGPTHRRDSFGLSTTVSLGDYDSSSFVDKSYLEKEKEPITPATPNSPALTLSPTVYSPSGGQSEKASPISPAGTSTHTLPVPTDVPIIRSPELAMHRPRPESEIIAVERDFTGANAV